jgi:hypothetical protein
VNFLSFSPDHPIGVPHATTRSSYPGSFVRVLETDGSVLGWIHDADFEAMDGERWFGWYPGAPTSALGVARTEGQGRVVTWAAPLDTVFFRQGRPDLAHLLVASSRWAAPVPPPLAVDAPVSVEVAWWRTGDGDLVGAFANRTTNDLYAIGTGVAIGAASSSAGGAGAGAGTLRAQHPRAVIPVTVSIEVPEASVAEGLVGTPDGGAFHGVGALEGVRLRRP